MKFAMGTMKGLFASAVLTLSMSVFAQATGQEAQPVAGQHSGAPATEASIKKLLEVTRARKMMEGMVSQMEGMLQGMVQQMAGGKALAPEQRQILDKMQANIFGLFKMQMSWDVLEPMMFEIYQEVFTEEEVLGMLAFYASPIGQATIQKMPLVARASMQRTQAQMKALMPKLQEIQHEALREIEACCEVDDKEAQDKEEK